MPFSSLSDHEIATALREALEVGAGNAVSTLGRQGGFLDNPRARIELPETFSRIARGMRVVGLGRDVDVLVETMNRAAEQAVPEARNLILNTVRLLTIDDARNILTGPDDAATRYLRNHTEAELSQRFLPIVGRATKRVRLAEVYDRFASRGVAFGLVRADEANLDLYITRHALDALYLAIADEERAIRANPLQSGKRYVRKVFGAIVPR